MHLRANVAGCDVAATLVPCTAGVVHKFSWAKLACVPGVGTVNSAASAALMVSVRY